MTNPLLTPFELPPFSKILPEHVVPAVTKALNDCRENVERVVAQGAPYTWENLCQPLAEVDDVLGRIFSPVSHLNSVKNSPELREAYEQTLPLAHRLCMTEIAATPPRADAFFPPYDGWIKEAEERHEADEAHPHAFAFVDYVRPAE